MKNILILLVLSVFSVSVSGQSRDFSALRTDDKVVIDGNLKEADWSKARCASGFITYEPQPGADPAFDAEVCVLYDDKALYIGATMYDESPEKILREFTRRDDDNGNTDMFTIQLNPNNDGRNLYEFKLTASNVQTDVRISDGSSDYDWDAVWVSAVRIHDEGWTAEIKIPYSAIRFPDKDMQQWSVNFWRLLRRKRELSSWNPVEKEKGAKEEQMGMLDGLNNINPPLRLSFYPYVSTSVDFYGDAQNPSWGLSGGMDMKLGLSKSHTLDMTLIPDFSQVKSDNETLNLTPYETYYDENRPFFTEGTELFDKVGLFYSRRIGKIPQKYDDIRRMQLEGYDIINNPRYSRLINAVKITGRDENNLGVGFLNAVTANTFADVRDTLGREERILTEPWANYNMLVLDQSFRNNSYVNLTNARVDRPDADYSSNVLGTAYRLMEKSNRYGVYGKAAWSHIKDSVPDNDSLTDGYKFDFGIGKLNGKWQYWYNFNLKSDTYDPNDFGYLRENNSIDHVAQLRYNIYEPVWQINKLRQIGELGYSTTYKSLQHRQAWFWSNTYAETVNYTSIWNDLVYYIGEKHDYYEAREPGRVYKFRPINSEDIYISTDYRKTLALDFKIGGFSNLTERYGFYGRLAPRWRMSDKITLRTELTYNLDYHDRGYVNNVPDNEIIFGERDVETYTTSLSFSWVFNNKMYLNLDVRHYWRMVDYYDYFSLQEDGYLSESIPYDQDHDINFNTFNVDMLYSWNFAPGSYLSLMWKQQLYASEFIPESERFPSLGENINNLFKNTQHNSLSLRVIYYLDWQYFS